MQRSLFPCSPVSPALYLTLYSLRRAHSLCMLLLLLLLANRLLLLTLQARRSACPVGGALSGKPLALSSFPAPTVALRGRVKVVERGGDVCPPSRTCGLLHYHLWAPPPPHLSPGLWRTRPQEAMTSFNRQH